MKKLEAELKITDAKTKKHIGKEIRLATSLSGKPLEDLRSIIRLNRNIAIFLDTIGRCYAQGVIDAENLRQATDNIINYFEIKKIPVFEADSISDIKAGATVLDESVEENAHVKVFEGEPEDENGEALIFMDFEGRVDDLPLHTHPTSRVLSVIQGKAIGYQSVMNTNEDFAHTVLKNLKQTELEKGSIVAYPADILHTFSTNNAKQVMGVITYHGSQNSAWVSFDDNQQYNPYFRNKRKIYPGRKLSEQITN